MSEIGTVRNVKAVAISYFLDVSENWRNQVGDNWEKQFLNDIEKFAATYYPDVEVQMSKYRVAVLSFAMCLYLCWFQGRSLG